LHSLFTHSAFLLLLDRLLLAADTAAIALNYYVLVLTATVSRALALAHIAPARLYPFFRAAYFASRAAFSSA